LQHLFSGFAGKNTLREKGVWLAREGEPQGGEDGGRRCSKKRKAFNEKKKDPSAQKKKGKEWIDEEEKTSPSCYHSRQQ